LAAVGVAAVSLFISPSGMLGTILDVPINTLEAEDQLHFEA